MVPVAHGSLRHLGDKGLGLTQKQACHWPGSVELVFQYLGFHPKTSAAALYNGAAWEFERDGEELKVRIEGQLVFNNIAMRLDAVLRGLGLAYMPEDLVQPHVEDGRLIRVLMDWCAPFPGYHLYYPSRRQTSPAFMVFRDALRYMG
jgi:DNA-binding transcriptional LysR family regulator